MRIKPLKWGDVFDAGSTDGYLSSDAITPLGRYEVWRLKQDSPFRWEGPDRNGYMNGTSPYEYDSIEAAKEAAFKYYSERARQLFSDIFDLELPKMGEEAND